MKGWVLDELASAGRENLDAQHVTRYDGIENAAAAGEVQLLRDFGMDRSSTVVDMGAGTGQFTIAVAPYVRQVIAVDISPRCYPRHECASPRSNRVRPDTWHWSPAWRS